MAVGKDRVDAEATMGEDEKEDVDNGLEARSPKIARRPMMPTKAMVLAHEVHHADYREWCAHCVAGKKESVINIERRTKTRTSPSSVFMMLL